MAKTQIVVTGGAGFIGSNLVNRLIDMGHQVTVLDNLRTGDASNIHNYNYPLSFDYYELLSYYNSNSP